MDEVLGVWRRGANITEHQKRCEPCAAASPGLGRFELSSEQDREEAYRYVCIISLPVIFIAGSVACRGAKS